MPPHSPTDAARALRDMSSRWRASGLGERQAFHSWFLDFCAALGIDAPAPDGADSYCFEQPVKVISGEGAETTNFIDLWKAGHVALEAKAGGTASNDVLMRKAFRQVKSYIAAEPGTVPPYLMVVDVPRELIVWDRWSGAFGDFAAGRRIPLDALPDRPDDIALLQDVFTRPASRDPRGKAQQVTREIAGKLAELAATFEDRGFEPERVARFLMRCVFCFFAEDVDLLPKKLFERTLVTARETGDGAHVAEVLTSLWKTMDSGGMFGADRIQRFNGHFFRTIESLPLEPADVTLLIDSARFDWSRVEPSIFGTLLVRALDPVERHRLGAEYTPREYIERLVEPTVVEPIRERWSAVQARMTQLEESTKSSERKQAEQEVLDFHAWLRGLRFLDPACGSGNFLYVTMAAVKRIELEVMNELARLGGGQQGLVLDEVHPRQFHGIEVNWWAREIAELTLWIGYHQFWREAHGGRTPPVPILEDTGTIECRDAILAWDNIVHRPEKDRPDPTPRIVHPVTGELVPDPNVKLPYMEYVNARSAEWPVADFIVGNPPYIGSKRMRDALGDGYVEALRASYPSLPNSTDLVLYWWFVAGVKVGLGEVARAGLITTNALVQTHARQVVQYVRAGGAHVIWAVRNHPWTDESDGAAVRVALTVLASGGPDARLVTVNDRGVLTGQRAGRRLNDDLSFSADVVTAAATPLLASRGVASMGFALHGAGFIVDASEAQHLFAMGAAKEILRPYVAGKDLTTRPRVRCVVDFAYLSRRDAESHPVLFDIVRARVKPERDANARDTLREHWWQFGWPRRELRAALETLPRFVVTTETAKHRMFQFLPSTIAVDHSAVVIALSESWHLGVLSSSCHIVWALAAGSRLETRPRYTKTLCFDPFPFPSPPDGVREAIGHVSDRLDQHRKDAIARDERVTMTGMYNVVEKLRSGAALTPKERAIHEVAACGILRDMHDELDALVAEAYGWPWPMERDEILERLVALHDERIEEEKRGLVRWLRPDYQMPRFAPDKAPADLGIHEKAASTTEAPAKHAAWPKTAVEQLAALAALVSRGSATVDTATAAFNGAHRNLVARHLETLAMLGEVAVSGERYVAARAVA